MSQITVKKIADALGSIPIMTLNPHVLHDRLLINDAYQNNNGLVDCWKGALELDGSILF